jgi:hypothetical protein
MPGPKWSLRGEYMESCNCDYLCPCIYTNPQEAATHDHCTAVMVFRIAQGNFGGTRLDGLKFALVIRSGPVIADGNWLFAGVVDASATGAQRTALAAIVGGDAGDRGSRFTQPQRRAALHRQHRTSGEPTVGASPVQGDTRQGFRSRSGPGG